MEAKVSVVWNELLKLLAAAVMIAAIGVGAFWATSLFLG
jgi:hypothetical protein